MRATIRDRQQTTDNRQQTVFFENKHSFPKIPALQGLRAFAFICIFLHHSGLPGMGALGPYGVSVFLVLSGFLMGGKYIGNDKQARFGLRFVFTKICRLYPLHIVTMILMAGYYFFIEYSFSLLPWLFGVLEDVFLIMPYNGIIGLPVQSFNGPSWYLSVCVISYFIFPVILKLMRYYRSRRVAYVVIFVSGVIILLVSFTTKFFPETMQKYFTYNFPISRLPEFFIGCNIGFLYVTRSNKGGRNTNVLLIVAVCFTLASWYIYDNGLLFLGQEYFRYTAIFMIPTILIIVAMANENVMNPIFKSKIAVAIGDLSPYAFLIHLPVIYAMRLVFDSWNNDLRIVILSFIVSLILSMVYQFVVKKVSHRKAKKDIV